MMIRLTLFSSLLILVCIVSTSAGETIDFSSLMGADVADGDGQTFDWVLGAEMGTVTLHGSWDGVNAVDGALNTPTQLPAGFNSPFTGALTMTFSRPVQLSLMATFPSLTRDGLDGGRFEQVELSTSDPVSFVGAPGTTAVYSGEGTSTILADDTLTPTPVLADWGFVGSGLATTYELRYTSTSAGLSETFDVTVTSLVPEPSTLVLSFLAGITLFVAARRRPAQPLD